MKDGFRTVRTLLLIAAACSLAACKSAPSQFYTLTPLASPAPPGPSSAAASHLAVYVEPVEVPDYLDRPQIVTREGENEVKVSEFHRWAGSLGENISTVLAEDLAVLLGSDRVLVNSGAPMGKADYTVAMRILRLDCLPGDHVFLKTQWRIVSADTKKVTTRVSNITERVTDGEYGTTVAAVNKAVEQVSRQIAAEIPIR